MARHSNDQSLKEAVEDMLKNYKLDEKMRQLKLIESWETIMGTTVANRTTEIKLSGKRLHVVLSSASLRQELYQERDKIIDRLNETAGARVIDEIIFQ